MCGDRSLERGRCKDLQTENDLNDIKSLLTCRKTRLRTRYIFLATTGGARGGRRKIRSSRYQYFPSHMSRMVDKKTPRNLVLQGWLVRASGTYFSRTSFSGGGKG